MERDRITEGGVAIFLFSLLPSISLYGRPGLQRFLLDVRQPDGSFVMHRDGELDIRYGEEGVRYGEEGVRCGEEGVRYGEEGVRYGEEGVRYRKEGVRYGEEGIRYGEENYGGVTMRNITSTIVFTVGSSTMLLNMITR